MTFQLTDITTPVPAHFKRVLPKTSIASGDGPDGDVRRVGDTYDIKGVFADSLIESGQAVLFEPAVILAGLVKAAGISTVSLASSHMTGLPAALRGAKVVVHSGRSG